jgi:hypothetical protein
MDLPDAVRTIGRELADIFGVRLRSFVAYGLRGAAHGAHDDSTGHHGAAPLVHTMAVVEGLSTADLRACALRLDDWRDVGLATPLLVASREFARSIDAFPYEFGAILADHVVVSGESPFDGVSVDTADLRRACEVEARGHLLHLRQGFIEARGRADALAVLIVRSAPAFAALVLRLASLDGDASSDTVDAAARAVERRLLAEEPIVSKVTALASVDEISSAEAEQLFPPYLEAVERLVAYVDSWK